VAGRREVNPERGLPYLSLQALPVGFVSLRLEQRRRKRQVMRLPVHIHVREKLYLLIYISRYVYGGGPSVD
jgi:hypothetical protein